MGPIDKTNQETAVRRVNQQNKTGRAHARYPVRKSHYAGYFKVKVAYSAGNSQSRDTKYEPTC